MPHANTTDDARFFIAAGLAPEPGEIGALPLSDFFGVAQALNDSVRVLGVFAAPEWDELSDDGRQWVAALVRETLAHVPVEHIRNALGFAEATEPDRVLMVPCSGCSDGFTTTDDRHARTRMDVCSLCAGTHMVPAKTGTSPETSAPPIGEAGTAIAYIRETVASIAAAAEPFEKVAADIEAAANSAGVLRTGSFLDPVPVLYRNWQNETRRRQLAPAFGPSGPMNWHPADEWHAAGWRIRCLDAEGGHRREYALTGVLAWGAEAIAERLREMAAVRTLEADCYAYVEGAAFWRPPVGPEPDFEAADRRRELAARLRALCEGMPRGLAETATLQESAEALDAVPLQPGQLPPPVLRDLAVLQSLVRTPSEHWSDGFGDALDALRGLMPLGWTLSRSSENGPWRLSRVAAAGSTP